MYYARSLFFLVAVFCSIKNIQAQTTTPSENAIVFADSLLKSFRNNDPEQYTNLSYPGVITYYGGNKNFREYFERARALTKSGDPQTIKVIQVVHDSGEWQCVIRKTVETTIDGKKAHIISYIIGQSKDEGKTWKLVDVAQNSLSSLVYIMPDISRKLEVPRREIIFENAGS